MSNKEPTTENKGQNPLESMFPKIPYVIKEDIIARRFTVYLNEISEPNNFHMFIDLLQRAGENDVIYIHINSGGGAISTGMQILNAMEQCMATIITVLDGEAYSMAGIIFLAGNEYVINEHSSIMLHNYSSYGQGGKGLDLENSHANVKKIVGKFMDMYGSRILSKKEIKHLNKGEDIYFDKDQLISRLDKWSAKVLKKVEKVAKKLMASGNGKNDS